MFIRTFPWHHKGWKALLKYMEHDKTKLHGEEPFTIYHNTAPSMESAIEAFRENDSYRNKKIVKGTVLY